MQRHPGQSEPDFDNSNIPCYCILFDRYIGLGTDGHFEERDREFKSRKDAAPIFGKSEKGLDHMIEDGRVASIKVGGTVLVHVPTSSVLVQQRERWNWDGCPRCPKTP